VLEHDAKAGGSAEHDAIGPSGGDMNGRCRRQCLSL
jgi:hypothetical protein